MKRNKLILSIIFFSFFISCTKLDEQLYTEVRITDFGRNAAEINALIGPIYTTLKWHNLSWDNSIVMDELSADMMAIPGFKGGDWGELMFKEMMQHDWSAASTGFNGVYKNTLSSISLCNQIFHQININPVIPDTEKEQILAEIRGVRAFWYYTLIDRFGNVPIVTDFLDKSQPETKPRKEVYQFVLNELNEIKDKLRADVSISSYGKMTKGAAYTILAKMYLNAEVWNPEGGPKWQETIEACNSVLALDYVIENNWKTNFISGNDVSKEAILSAVFKAGGSGVQNDIAGNTLHYLAPIAMGLNVGTYNGFAATPSYVKAFDTTDIRYYGSFQIGPLRDPKTGEILITSHGRPLIHTVDMTMHEVDQDGWGWINQEEGARCIKWDYAPGLSTTMENDIHIFRLADVYLMKAEALLRSGGDVSEATALVNRLRVRAFTDPSKLLSTVTLNDIYKERRFEFAWEGFTRQDMIRFGTFLDARPPFKPWVSDPKYLLYYIPQEVIDANNKIQQNPGF